MAATRFADAALASAAYTRGTCRKIQGGSKGLSCNRFAATLALQRLACHPPPRGRARRRGKSRCTAFASCFSRALGLPGQRVLFPSLMTCAGELLLQRTHPEARTRGALSPRYTPLRTPNRISRKPTDPAATGAWPHMTWASRGGEESVTKNADAKAASIVFCGGLCVAHACSDQFEVSS